MKLLTVTVKVVVNENHTWDRDAEVLRDHLVRAIKQGGVRGYDIGGARNERLPCQLSIDAASSLEDKTAFLKAVESAFGGASPISGADDAKLFGREEIDD